MIVADEIAKRQKEERERKDPSKRLGEIDVRIHALRTQLDAIKYFSENDGHTSSVSKRNLDKRNELLAEITQLMAEERMLLKLRDSKRIKLYCDDMAAIRKRLDEQTAEIRELREQKLKEGRAEIEAIAKKPKRNPANEVRDIVGYITVKNVKKDANSYSIASIANMYKLPRTVVVSILDGDYDD